MRTDTSTRTPASPSEDVVDEGEELRNDPSVAGTATEVQPPGVLGVRDESSPSEDDTMFSALVQDQGIEQEVQDEHEDANAMSSSLDSREHRRSRYLDARFPVEPRRVNVARRQSTQRRRTRPLDQLDLDQAAPPPPTPDLLHLDQEESSSAPIVDPSDYESSVEDYFPEGEEVFSMMRRLRDTLLWCDAAMDESTANAAPVPPLHLRGAVVVLREDGQGTTTGRIVHNGTRYRVHVTDNATTTSTTNSTQLRPPTPSATMPHQRAGVDTTINGARRRASNILLSANNSANGNIVEPSRQEIFSSPEDLLAEQNNRAGPRQGPSRSSRSRRGHSSMRGITSSLVNRGRGRHLPWATTPVERMFATEASQFSDGHSDPDGRSGSDPEGRQDQEIRRNTTRASRSGSTAAQRSSFSNARTEQELRLSSGSPNPTNLREVVANASSTTTRTTGRGTMSTTTRQFSRRVQQLQSTIQPPSGDEQRNQGPEPTLGPSTNSSRSATTSQRRQPVRSASSSSGRSPSTSTTAQRQNGVSTTTATTTTATTGTTAEAHGATSSRGPPRPPVEDGEKSRDIHPRIHPSIFLTQR
ncbi:unnamed protein product [Amoebophrya sp. A25]|nr:unnamed protein product [Amoebophrya sp. A25]|eukprot:GSA25T00016050001.1